MKPTLKNLNILIHIFKIKSSGVFINPLIRLNTKHSIIITIIKTFWKFIFYKIEINELGQITWGSKSYIFEIGSFLIIIFRAIRSEYLGYKSVNQTKRSLSYLSMTNKCCLHYHNYLPLVTLRLCVLMVPVILVSHMMAVTPINTGRETGLGSLCPVTVRYVTGNICSGELF